MSNLIGPALAKQSLAILKQRKSLLIFMTLAAILTGAVFTAAAIPLFTIEDLALQHSPLVTTGTLWMATGIILLLFIALNMITLLFCSGLVACCLKQLKNEPYSLMIGFNALFCNSIRLYAWQSIGNAYGTFIKVMAYWVDDFDKSPLALNLLAGLPWNVATQLMIPVILENKLNTKQAIQHSAELIKKTWNSDPKKTLKSQLSPGMKISLLRIALFTVLILTAAFSSSPIGIISIVIVTLSAVLILILTTIIQTLQMLTISAVYLFSLGIDTSRYYDPALLKEAFHQVKRKIPQ
ncbi:MAG: DUF6159 family protein [Coxiellaceae bacterium]|nr:DUF6159 family protein [Coxiellaceae bacterium]